MSNRNVKIFASFLWQLAFARAGNRFPAEGTGAEIEHYRGALRIVQEGYSKDKSDTLNPWLRQLPDTALHSRMRIEEIGGEKNVPID